MNLKFTCGIFFSNYIRYIIFNLEPVRLNDAISNCLSYNMKRNRNIILRKTIGRILRIEDNTKIITKNAGGR